VGAPSGLRLLPADERAEQEHGSTTMACSSRTSARPAGSSWTRRASGTAARGDPARGRPVRVARLGGEQTKPRASALSRVSTLRCSRRCTTAAALWEGGSTTLHPHLWYGIHYKLVWNPAMPEQHRGGRGPNWHKAYRELACPGAAVSVPFLVGNCGAQAFEELRLGAQMLEVVR